MMDAWAVRLAANCRPGCRIRLRTSIRFGTGWNTAENYAKGRMLSCCCGGFDFVRAALALEIPYANMRGCVLDAAKARELGSVLLRVAAAFAGVSFVPRPASGSWNPGAFSCDFVVSATGKKREGAYSMSHTCP
ncbi:MAG: hypothetical protein V8T86_18320 [Victivallis sp.]